MVPNVPYLNVMGKVTSPDYTPTTEGKLRINSLIRMDFYLRNQFLRDFVSFLSFQSLAYQDVRSVIKSHQKVSRNDIYFIFNPFFYPLNCFENMYVDSH